MLFPYLPAEVVVPLAAAAFVSDPLSLWLFTISTTLGGTVGALIPYSVSVKGGRLAKTRFEARVSLSDERRERSHRWYVKWGEPSVIWGRFLPGLRSIVSVPAGIAEMSAEKFTLYTAIGNAAFYSSVAILVHYSQIQSLRTIGISVVEGAPEYMPRIAIILILTIIGWRLIDRYVE